MMDIMDRVNKMLANTGLRVDLAEIAVRDIYKVMDGSNLLATGFTLQAVLEKALYRCRDNADSLADAISKTGLAERSRWTKP